jgi:hypothetical protein
MGWKDQSYICHKVAVVIDGNTHHHIKGQGRKAVAVDY